MTETRNAKTTRKLALVAGATETALKQQVLHSVRLEATDMQTHDLVVTLTINEGLPSQQIFSVACADTNGGEFANYMLGNPLLSLRREARNVQHRHKTGELADRCPLCGQGDAQDRASVFEVMLKILERERNGRG
jgi:hypothetical protein